MPGLELKSCPLCASPNTSHDKWHRNHVTCNSCGASTGGRETEVEAALAWNTRALLEHQDWHPIESHPRDEDECLLGMLDANGLLEVADRGGWTPGENREEWAEVEEGVCVKLWEEEEDGNWWSNYEIINEPTHWQPLIIPTLPSTEQGELT